MVVACEAATGEWTSMDPKKQLTKRALSWYKFLGKTTHLNPFNIIEAKIVSKLQKVCFLPSMFTLQRLKHIFFSIKRHGFSILKAGCIPSDPSLGLLDPLGSSWLQRSGSPLWLRRLRAPRFLVARHVFFG